MASSDPNVLLVRFDADGAWLAVVLLYKRMGVKPVCAMVITPV